MATKKLIAPGKLYEAQKSKVKHKTSSMVKCKTCASTKHKTHPKSMVKHKMSPMPGGRAGFPRGGVKPPAIGQTLSNAAGKVGGWVKSGMPLPGAVQPKPGMTYLRGAQVPMPKFKKKKYGKK